MTYKQHIDYKKEFPMKGFTETRMLKPVIIYLVLFLTAASVSRADEPLANEGKAGLYTRSINRIIRMDDEEIDLATAALLLSREAIEPINLQRYRDRIDEMSRTILRRLDKKQGRYSKTPTGRFTPEEGRAAINEMNKYLFEEMGFKAVETADDSQDLFLHSVLDRKKGYCLSLSMLYLSIGERLGLPLYGVVVPGHFFVRYDDGRERFNIETTSGGGSPPDEYYIKKFKVPSNRQNIYMKNLNKLQSLGCFFNNLGNFYQETGDLDSALIELETAAYINPSLGMVHTNLGNIYLSKDMVDKAINQYLLALEINPNDSKTLNNIGNAYLRKGWIDKAISEYKASLRSDPNSVDAHKNLAQAYSGQKMYQQAIAEIKKAMTLEPENKDVWVELGNIYRQMENYEAAIHQYRKVLYAEDDLIEPQYWLAVTYQKLEWIDEAIEEFRKLLYMKADSTMDEQFIFRARQDLGNIYISKKMYDTAIEEYRQALSMKNRYEDDPEEIALIYYNTAVAWTRKENYEKAVSAYLTAVELQPDLAEAHNGLGICYYYLQEYKSAWEHIQKAEALGFKVQEELHKAVSRQIN